MARSTTYLDYNATAPMLDEARSAMVDALHQVGNPSSVHGPGRAARAFVETARRQVASAIGRKAGEVVFTSGATEANNIVIRAAQEHGFRCLCSAVEHESVRNVPGVEPVGCDQDGRLDLSALESLVGSSEQPVFLALMAANNETGVIQPVEEAAEIVSRSGGAVHCDAVQAVGRLRLDSLSGQVDSFAISAHKIGGPQGVGALIAPRSWRMGPLVFGGAQEERRRAGTENVAGIAGLGVAVEIAARDVDGAGAVEALRSQLEQGLKQADPSVRVMGAEVDRLANTSCIAATGLPAETQVMALDLAGFAISSGSACSSGKVGVSHVLTAMGVDEELARCAIRVSIGRETIASEIDGFIESWGRLRQRHAASAA